MIYLVQTAPHPFFEHVVVQMYKTDLGFFQLIGNPNPSFCINFYEGNVKNAFVSKFIIIFYQDVYKIGIYFSIRKNKNIFLAKIYHYFSIYTVNGLGYV